MRSAFPGHRPAPSGRAGRGVRSGLGAALLLAAALGCDLAPQAATAAREITEVPLDLDTISFQGYRVGAREFEVRAAHAQVIAREKVVMERVHIAFVDEGRGAMTIDAPQAELDLLTDDFRLRGGVSGETAEGERFTTESLQYVRQARRLYSDQPVKVTRPGDVLAGEGMEIDVETRLLTIRRVRVVVNGA
jgi:LPS export ABC transporter protein LptC